MLTQLNPARVVALVIAVVILPLLLLATAANAQTTGTQVDEPGSFTSSFSVSADADQVPAQDDGSRGTPGATGTFNLRLNSDQDVICHDITLRGVNPPFSSPAPTATHIHDAPRGEVGPAVWLFPDPEMSADGTLRTTGCLQAAFTADGNAMGFALADIETAAPDYYVDNHTQGFEAGSVRGQFSQAMPVGGVDTGAGGTASQVPGLALAAALATTVVAGALLCLGGARRRSSR